jgi:hypothetical protein
VLVTVIAVTQWHRVRAARAARAAASELNA